MTKRRKIVAAVLAFAIIALVAVIFAHSAKSGSESVKTSDKFLSVPDKFLGIFGLDASRYTLSYIVRKTAHFVEYFALGALASAFIFTVWDKTKHLAFAPVFSLFTALCDEFIIQGATEGRSPELRDVGIDLFGAIAATAVFLLAVLIRRKKRKDR